MMKPLYKQPLVEAVILASGILCTVVLIHGIQNFIALGGKPVTSQIAQKTNPDLVQVAAGGGCPYSASVSLGQTAGGSEMRERPDRNMKIYNPFSPEYINRLVGTEKPGTAKVPGPVDPKLPVIGTIFGYKPTSVNYYAIQEVAEKKDVTSPWVQYLLGIPTETGTEIRAPQTGYDIGGGKMGLVVYAKDDQIAIHVGRHEYLFASSPESGGYWIYLKGLCVNSEIVSQYNANAASRTQLPELAKGELLGYAIGSEVLIAVRDNAADMAQRAVAAMCPVNRNRLVLHDSPRPPVQGSFRPCCKYDTLYIIAKQVFCITLELSYAAYRIPAHPIECIGSRKHPALHNPVERHR